MYRITTATRKVMAMDARIRACQGGTCFPAGIPVLLASGEYREIEAIRKGDTVLSLTSNLDIIHSEVSDYWENLPTKPLISFNVNGEIIRATYDHKFYTTEGYKELYKIVWGGMEASQRIQLKLLCEQYGAHFDDDSSRWHDTSDYEALCDNDKEQKDTASIVQDSDGRKICSCESCSSINVVTESERTPPSRPSEWGHDGQQSDQPRVGHTIGEHQESVRERSAGAKMGGEEPQGEVNGQAGGGDSQGMGCDSSAEQETVSGRLWCLGSEYQRHTGVQNLSALTPKQIQIQEPEKTFAISVRNVNYFVGENKINVSNSASKTVSIVLNLINLAQKDEKPTLTSIISESFPHLKRGVMRDFLLIMEEHGYFKPDLWNKTNYTYTFETGSKIEFFSADQPSKVRGPRRDRLFINEANNIPHEAFDQLEVRTKDFIYLDWNPTNEFWFYDQVKGKRDDVEHIILTYLDNEGLSDEIIKSIEQRRHNKSWWKVYGEGQLGEVEGKIYKDWKIIDELPHTARLVRRGLDFGYSNDPTAVVDIYEHDGGYILDEVLFRKGLSNRQIADFLNELPDVMTLADSAEPKSIDEIKGYGITIMGANKGPGSVMQGIQFVQDQRISVTKRSTNVIREYRNYLWKTDKNGKIVNEPEHPFSHSMDCLVAGTQVMTSDGYKPIEFITTKDKVVTRKGLRFVTDSWLVRDDANVIEVVFSNGRKIIGTPNHKVWTTDGWKVLSRIRYGDKIQAWKLLENTTEETITSILKPNRDTDKNISMVAMVSSCIGKYGKTITERFRLIVISTTRMVIRSITGLKILSVLTRAYIAELVGRIVSRLTRTVIVVVRYSSASLFEKLIGSAPINAKANGDETTDSMTLRRIVSFAKNYLAQTSTTKIDSAPVHVVLKRELKRTEAVYDITVEDQNEYFANDILVHNSIRYGFNGYKDEAPQAKRSKRHVKITKYG